MKRLVVDRSGATFRRQAQSTKHPLTAMRLIPVLDLKGGVVVRGVGGRRDEYRPVQSVVSKSSEPVEVARALRERFGFREFYIADLDAIAGAAPHRDVLCELARRDLRLLVDAGLRDVAAGRALLSLGSKRVIAALETSPGPEHLRSLVAALGAEKVTFSVDMKAGSLLTAGDGWTVGVPALAGTESLDVRPPFVASASADACSRLDAAWTEVHATPTPTPPEGGTPTGDDAGGLLTAPLRRLPVSPSPRPSLREGRATPALELAERVLECEVRSLILLDLAGVGEGRGVPTLELCRAVRGLSPDVEIITGGGVRGTADLEALERAGVDGVLIASALHDGSLTPEECWRWRT